MFSFYVVYLSIYWRGLTAGAADPDYKVSWRTEALKYPHARSMDVARMRWVGQGCRWWLTVVVCVTFRGRMCVAWWVMRKFKLYLKVDRRELNSIPNLCKILPKSIKNLSRSDPNASLERFRSQVATRSVSGWSPLNYRITPFRAPWTKNVIQVRAFGRPWIQNGSQTAFV